MSGVEQLSGAEGQNGAAMSGDGPDEFDLAMDELAPKDEPPAPAAGDVEPGPSAPDPKDDHQPGSAPEAGTTQQAAGQEPPASDQPTDIWANAPAELRAAHETALRDQGLRYNSVVGRLSTADRQLAELRRNQQQPQAQDGTAPTPPQQQQQQEQGDDPFSEEKIKRLREDYGEVAGPLVDMIEALRGKVGQLEPSVTQIGQERHQAALTAQEQLLAGQHSDWVDVVKDERFHGWVQTQPRFIQDAITRNADDIVDGHEAARIIGMYKTEIGAVPVIPPTPTPTPTPTPALDARRQRQLENGRDAGRQGNGPVANGIPDDFDAAMDAYVAKAERTGRL